MKFNLRNEGLILLLLICFNSQSWCQNRVEIIIPTFEEETDYVWRSIQDIKFFEEHNYPLSLPAGALIDSLLNKSRNNQLVESDYEALKALMKSRVYKRADYQNAYKKLEEQSALINKMANKLSKNKWDWGFKEFDLYAIHLTLYGSGGSYDPEIGSITIFATIDGKFKQYDDPANTIIHEITHIGIEDSIIGKYKVPHPLKERIVDKMVLLNFEKYLPDYKMQNMGDARIDQYLSTKKDLANLDQIIEQFLQDH